MNTTGMGRISWRHIGNSRIMQESYRASNSKIADDLVCVTEIAICDCRPRGIAHAPGDCDISLVVLGCGLKVSLKAEVG